MLDYGDAILTALDSAGGKITGRTAIQKLLYLASQKGIVKDTYSPHYYGPYSAEASNSLLELCSLDFVDEEIEHSTIVTREWRRFSYSLTERGKAYLNFIKEELGQDQDRMSQLVTKANDLTGLDVQSLSCAAKVHYLVKKKPSVTTEAIRKPALKFGWNLAQDQIEQATNLLVDLQLVKIVKT